MNDIQQSKRECKCALYHDNFQNWKQYDIRKAQLIIADIPYNLGIHAYASNPMWYKDGDNKNGESEKAASTFFYSDGQFRLPEYMHFCSDLLIKEPKQPGKSPAMIVFCAWQQINTLMELGQKHGFKHAYPLFFCKNFSAQVLKANMKIVGATETALVLYRDKLPKFNGGGSMVFDWFKWTADSSVPKIHPTQKPIPVLKRLIGLFTDPGDVVIDPCAGSGSTLRAAYEMGRSAYGFEVDRKFFRAAQEKMLSNFQMEMFC
jgi:site-specific DNA-methyltransferase (adenine-specific)